MGDASIGRPTQGNAPYEPDEAVMCRRSIILVDTRGLQLADYLLSSNRPLRVARRRYLWPSCSMTTSFVPPEIALNETTCCGPEACESSLTSPHCNDWRADPAECSDSAVLSEESPWSPFTFAARQKWGILFCKIHLIHPLTRLVKPLLYCD